MTRRLRHTLGAALVLAAAAAPVAGAAAPPPSSYANVAGPAALVGGAGEPSIGYNPKTDSTFFQAGLTTAKVDFAPATPTWTDVTEPTAATGLDPILYTDRATGRTFSSQLLLACSKASFTDDDGASWLPSQGCGVGTAVDHQTLGGGPYAPGPDADVARTIYPNAVYYCAQASVEASCATSFDGGATFGPGVPAYTAQQCANGLHGHIKVAPDGTAYLPVFDCGGEQAVVTSKDNGVSWTVDQIPGSTTQDESDPHVGIGDKGTLYVGYQGADGQDLGDKGYLGHARSEGHPWVSVKTAGSDTFSPPVDVGASLGIKNIQFPEVYAGDDDRAAYAFLGTTTAGDDQDPGFDGVWHLYVATTVDGGATWTTVDATPSDPVQRGCIWLQGGSSNCRNLLDFNDITMDRTGRVLVAYADGCTGGCVTDTSDTSKSELGTIARQVGGPRLLAAFDPVTGTTGSTGPTVAATSNSGSSTQPTTALGPSPAPQPAASSAVKGISVGAPARSRARLVLGALRRRGKGFTVTVRATSGTLPAVTVRLLDGYRLMAIGTSGRVGRKATTVRLVPRGGSRVRAGSYRLVAFASNAKGAHAGRAVRLR